MRWHVASGVALCLLSCATARPGIDWPNYGNDPGGSRDSSAAQINRANVAQLKVAWTFHTGDISDGKHGSRRSGFEATPLLVDGTLYLTTPFNRVIALDPANGVQRWAFDPHIDRTLGYGDGLINRGVAAWLDTAHLGAPCHRRIFEATLDARLVAVDAATGLPCAEFGRAGEVSLRDVPRYHPGWYHMTSPPAVIDDLVVVGSAIDDNARSDMPSGVVRAFDARTGALRWSWDPIPPNAGAWRTGAANAWSVMAVDPARHLVFVPTGSASPDFFGGDRKGDDRWASSVVALRSQTGQLAWGFQLVHHNLWDYDSASPPLLASLRHPGGDRSVVIQGNKAGYLYVLDRETGQPVFPVAERPMPQSDLPGEQTSPTQPVPSAPPPLAGQRLTPDDAWGATPADREICRNLLKGMRNGGIFTPPSTQDTLDYPGHVGGMSWSGYAFDAERQLLLVATNNLPFAVQLIPGAQYEAAQDVGRGRDFSRQAGAPYGMSRTVLHAPSGAPCNAPPWGQLAAVDLVSGKIRWQVPTGTIAGFPGSPTLGGPIVTAGGLVFLGGTFDRTFRAFDIETGRELWKAELPAGGQATPMTYQLANGKQYVVIAAGGHAKRGEDIQSDALVAFALP